jgi:hypothetical protein
MRFVEQRTTAGVPAPAYQQFWTDKRTSLTNGSKGITKKYRDAASSVHQLSKVLCDIENLASNTPVSVGESEEWAAVINSAEDNRKTYCKALRGKPLHSALYGAYTITLKDLNMVLKTNIPQEGGFKEEAQHRGSSLHCEESSNTNVIYEGDNKELLRSTQDIEHGH